MRWILCTMVALTGMTLTGCTIEDHDDNPQPAVVKEREVVHDQPVVVEKHSDAAPAKVEVHNNVDR